jgi:hypothetical protein
MPNKHLQTITLLMARTRLMQRSFLREARRLDRRARTGAITIADGWPAITFYNLYLANLQVLIEGWDKSLFYDQRVDDLLRKGYRDRVRRFRNAVFHPGPFNDARVLQVYQKHQELRDWADELLDEVGRFIKRELRREHVAGLRGAV